MAITEYVYSPDYPANYKTVTVDLDRRIPTGAAGDEKYILKFSTSAYNDAVARTSPDDIYMYDMRRGWAESFVVSSPLVLAGGTLTVAIDESDVGAITIDLPTGTYNGSTVAAQLQSQIQAVATVSGTKVDATNKLSYLNALVEYVDGRFRIISGSVKNSYNDTSNYKNTSCVKVPGGTAEDTLGFTTGYPNSFDLATTASGELHAPGSALVSFDDAVRFGVASLINQIDFSG